MNVSKMKSYHAHLKWKIESMEFIHYWKWAGQSKNVMCLFKTSFHYPSKFDRQSLSAKYETLSKHSPSEAKACKFAHHFAGTWISTSPHYKYDGSHTHIWTYAHLLVPPDIPPTIISTRISQKQFFHLHLFFLHSHWGVQISLTRNTTSAVTLVLLLFSWDHKGTYIDEKDITEHVRSFLPHTKH